jgi:hypothetical protein
LTIGTKVVTSAVLPGPHLTANRATFHIDSHPDHHLLEIGSVILIMTAFADLSTLAFKVERSGVEKD